MKWRLYRLPGSRENWHIDAGPGTTVINVSGFNAYVPSKSVDIGGNSVPRAWIEFFGELHVINGVAIWRHLVTSLAATDSGIASPACREQA